MRKEWLLKTLHHIRQLAPAPPLGELTDARLVERFVAQHDEAAFGMLVQRHGPRIRGVCQRILGNPHDAEDAFQATFLVLAAKARSIGRRDSLGSWLHSVAFRLSLQARKEAARHRARSLAAEAEVAAAPVPDSLEALETRAVLDEEVARLPRRYRSAVLLHYVEGRGLEEAARQMGWTFGQFRGMLFRARRLLEKRLRRRGLACSVALLGAGEPALSASLVDATIRAALLFAARSSDCGRVSASAVVLAKGALQTMFMTKVKVGVAVLLAACGIGLGVGTTGGQPPSATPLAEKNKVAGEEREAAELKRTPVWQFADPAVEVRETLSRVTYVLPNAKGKALVVLLREHVQGTTLEAKTDGDTLIVTTTPEAQQRIASFIALLRGDPLSKVEAEQAEKDFKIAEFYRRTDHPGSAYFYYEIVRRRYPGTKYAEQAIERMHELRAKAEKELGMAVPLPKADAEKTTGATAPAAASLVSAGIRVPSAGAPDTVTINKRQFRIPIAFNSTQWADWKLVELYSSTDQGASWKFVEPIGLVEVKDIQELRYLSFTFSAPNDGLYWFTVVTTDLYDRRTPADLKQYLPSLKVEVRTGNNSKPVPGTATPDRAQ